MRSKKALLNISTNLLLELVVVIYGFIVPKLIINTFGSNVNGLVSSITQFLAYIALLESGFGPVVKSVLYRPIAEKNSDEIANILKTSEKFFRTIAYIFLAYIAFLLLIYPSIINSGFDYIYTISLILIISISTFAEYYFGMTYKLYLQADQKKYVISVIQIVTYIINIFLIVLLIKLKFSIHFVKLFTGLIFVLRPLCQNIYVKHKYNINLKNAKADYVIKNKWDGFAQHIATVIHEKTDITVLSIFVNLVEVSVYAVYYLVIKSIKSLVQAFTNGIDATFGDMFAKKEKENLNNKFSMYEVLYNMINTIAFSCTLVLIVPFVSVYTKDITDANYIRYTFGALLVISEYIWAVRQPYNMIIKVAGHFKETRVGAWVECIVNIVISVILVNRYGLIGVAIGTIVAMTIRTIEFVYHTNRYILERSIWASVKKILLIVAETLVIVLVSNYLPYLSNVNYINWLINALMVGVVASIVTLVFTFIFFRKELSEVFIIFKKILKKKEKKV